MRFGEHTKVGAGGAATQCFGANYVTLTSVIIRRGDSLRANWSTPAASVESWSYYQGLGKRSDAFRVYLGSLFTMR